ESYVNFADIFMRFENDWTTYQSYNHPSWMDDYDPSKWWDAVHTASPGDEAPLVALSRANLTGTVSFNGGSYGYPATWTTFVDAVDDANGTPVADESAYGALFFSGPSATSNSAGVAIKAAGTTTAGSPLSNFTMSANNRLRYD